MAVFPKKFIYQKKAGDQSHRPYLAHFCYRSSSISRLLWGKQSSCLSFPVASLLRHCQIKTTFLRLEPSERWVLPSSCLACSTFLVARWEPYYEVIGKYLLHSCAWEEALFLDLNILNPGIIFGNLGQLFRWFIQHYRAFLSFVVTVHSSPPWATPVAPPPWEQPASIVRLRYPRPSLSLPVLIFSGFI